MNFYRGAAFMLHTLIHLVPLCAGDYTWEPIGPGGGGRPLVSAISPTNPKLLFSASDIYGSYRSTDGGNTWAIIPLLPTGYVTVAPYNSHSAFVFRSISSSPERVYASNGGGFHQSDDAEHEIWTQVPGPWNNPGWNYPSSPRVVIFDASSGAGVAIFAPPAPTNSSSLAAVYVLQSDATTWTSSGTLPLGTGTLINGVFNDAVEPTVVIAATTGIYHGTLSNQSWTQTSPPGASGNQIMDFSGTASQMYATASSSETVHGVLYSSTTGGISWEQASTTGIDISSGVPSLTGVATCIANPEVVYVAAGGTTDSSGAVLSPAMIYRSNNGGDSWFPVLDYKAVAGTSGKSFTSNGSWLSGLWGWNHAFASLSVSATNSAVVMATTITSAYISTTVSSSGLSGGTTWQQIHAPNGTSSAQPGGGMQIMSCWDYYFSPHSDTYGYQFAAMTDFAGWRTTDNATTWHFNQTYGANTYALAFDPDPSVSKIWAATSNVHDLPMWDAQSSLGTGGGKVIVSTDGGVSWDLTTANKGLPGLPVTDIWIDPSSDTSSTSSRVLWAAVPGKGAYRWTDQSANWTAHNDGINDTTTGSNLNVLRIRGDGHGGVYAMTTIHGGYSGALYKLNNNTLSWSKIFPDSNISGSFLTTFTIDPNDPNVIYASALSTDARNDNGGGAWKLLYNGTAWNWTKVSAQPCYAISVDPTSAVSTSSPASQHLFASFYADLGSGLYECDDAAVNGNASWTPVHSYPFGRPLKVAFDPRNPTFNKGNQTIVVTGFGGGIHRGTSN